MTAESRDRLQFLIYILLFGTAVVFATRYISQERAERLDAAAQCEQAGGTPIYSADRTRVTECAPR